MASILDELLGLATAAAVQAGRAAAGTAQASRSPVSTKASKTDFVTATDRANEARIQEQLLAARPNDSILGEEGADVTGTSGVRWIIDPIDGTVNFSYGMPGYCTSIAAEIDEEIAIGVVYDPLREEVFSAQRDGGAFLNGSSITRGAAHISLAEAVVGTGFDYRVRQRHQQALQLVTILPNIGDIRRIGSAALELCWVACNRLDAYFESGTKAWDRAAGSLIATEAGAEVFMLEAASPGADSTVVAAAPDLSQALAELIVRSQR